jgi:hypothetical protein
VTGYKSIKYDKIIFNNYSCKKERNPDSTRIPLHDHVHTECSMQAREVSLIYCCAVNLL